MTWLVFMADAMHTKLYHWVWCHGRSQGIHVYTPQLLQGSNYINMGAGAKKTLETVIQNVQDII